MKLPVRTGASCAVEGVVGCAPNTPPHSQDACNVKRQVLPGYIVITHSASRLVGRWPQDVQSKSHVPASNSGPGLFHSTLSLFHGHYWSGGMAGHTHLGHQHRRPSLGVGLSPT